MDTMPYLLNETNKVGAALIIVEHGNIRKYFLDFRPSWTMGRSVPEYSPDISVTSPIVGRKHGEFICMDGEWYYIDKGSINGTLYNGKRIEQGLNARIRPILLQDGDTLCIDTTSLDKSDSRSVMMLFMTTLVNRSWNVYPLNKRNTIIGKNSDECSIVQDGGSIAEKYAKIAYINGHYYLSNCMDSVEICLNGKPLAETIQLKKRDKISFCDCHFIFTGNSLIYSL